MQELFSKSDITKISIPGRTIYNHTKKLNDAGLFSLSGKTTANGRPEKLYRFEDLPRKWQKLILEREKQIAESNSAAMDETQRSQQTKLSGRSGGKESCDANVANRFAESNSAAMDETQRLRNERSSEVATEDASCDAEEFTDAPSWARAKAAEKIEMLQRFSAFNGQRLKDRIAEWNNNNPKNRTSYRSIMRARADYKKDGLRGLLPEWGKSAGKTSVSDELYEFFRARYMKEGGPSAHSCWLYTVGYAAEKGIDPETIPSESAFLRRLDKETPEQAQIRARKGHSKWYRTCANHIERDYSAIRCGEVWVSDHAQVDVAVFDERNGKVCFPWITAWTDFKSGLFVGYDIHCEAPFSDHIFISFKRAAERYGLPKEVILDNGKDYRSKDFAGGRSFVKVKLDDAEQKKANTMLSLLGITPHFAIPYNAQTKPIERKFNTNKQYFSKNMPGYRGGNVVERPEKLKEEIAKGEIMKFSDFKQVFTDYIENCINKAKSQGKNLNGMSPLQLWNSEKPQKRMVTPEALRLFCTRTSSPVRIGRNGITDSKLGVTYWAEWMIGRKGDLAYLRRDLDHYEEAWVFDENDDFMGKAQIHRAVPALAVSETSKQQLADEMARKRKEQKIIKGYIEVKVKESPSDLVRYLGKGIEAVNGGDTTLEEQKIIELARSKMDEVVLEAEKMEKEGTWDLPDVGNLPSPNGTDAGEPPALRQGRKKLVLFESDK